MLIARASNILRISKATDLFINYQSNDVNKYNTKATSAFFENKKLVNAYHSDSFLKPTIHKIESKVDSTPKNILKIRYETSDKFNFEYLKVYLEKYYKANIDEGPTSIQVDCPKNVKNKNNRKNLYIHKNTGFVYCYKCFRTFDHYQLHELFLINKISQKVCYSQKSSKTILFEDVYKIKTDPITDMPSDMLSNITLCHNYDKINSKAMKNMEIRASQNYKEIFLPMKSPNPQNNYVESLYGVSESNGKLVTRYLFEKNSKKFYGLFGRHTLLRTHVVFTSNIFDTIRFSSQSKYSVFTVLEDAKLFKLSYLPFFEDYKKVVFWITDKSQIKNITELVALLGRSRCFIYRQDLPNESKPPDETETESDKKKMQIPSKNTIQNHSIRHFHHKILTECKIFSKNEILSYDQLKADIYDILVNSETAAGVKWKRYTDLNLILKGHRQGELTILTGRTGSGKTTFLSEYSLDLAENGVRTLWGSFEISNKALIKAQLSQFSFMDVTENINKFDYISQHFSKLPIWYIKNRGDQHIDDIMKILTKCVYTHDIHHIIIDNLQFMMGMSFLKSHTDRFMVQDRVIFLMREFATKYNCHVTLVIHPRKESSIDDLTISSIFGSAKSTQEADNIIILQTKNHGYQNAEKKIQIVKNRFDGVLGDFPIKFNPENLTLAPLNDNTREIIENEKFLVDKKIPKFSIKIK
ncbi:Twinkle protein, mitochondrial [Intoshia linei]|uniref:Twinkle protein, mitochondrial n=1 Tax=Intoshia linei TaxID=1819745 RepID=A0A177B177_9BILA|nr:Twinkle protein, mitochondrial [Intoshia linei]